MANGSSRLLIGALLLSAAGCGSAEEADSRQAAEIPADQEIRTADPYARGYADADFPRIQEIAPGVYSYEQLRSAGEERFTTVSLFVVTNDGVVVADGQGSVEETQRMLDSIASITDQPVRALVIGSDHGDHTAGNAAFPDDIRVFAHATSAAALAAAAERSSGPTGPAVTDLVVDRVVFGFGDVVFHAYFLGRAHTGGDLVLYLPEERVMFMSEAYLHRVFPAMRSAYPSEWVEMIERAQGMDVDIFVPGHGFVDHPTVLAEELEIFQEAIRTVIAEGYRLHEAGVPLDRAREEAVFGELESWSLRSSQGPRAIQQVYAEIEGTLPGGSP